MYIGIYERHKITFKKRVQDHVFGRIAQVICHVNHLTGVLGKMGIRDVKLLVACLHEA